MVSTEVQRTLVKSPPELWAELSDPHSLARHLGELGEIRITRAEPETKLEWEAEGASGTVLINQAGWGTRVTLSLTREAAPAPAAGSASDTGPAVDAARDPQPDAGAEAQEPDSLPAELIDGPADVHEPLPSDEPQSVHPPEPSHQPEPTREPEPAGVQEPPAEPARPEARMEPRPGFFSRLFGRRRRAQAATPALSTDGPPAEARPSSPAQTLAGEHPAEQPRAMAARQPEQSDAFAALRRALTPEAVTTLDPLATPARITPEAVTTLVPLATPAGVASATEAELQAAEEAAQDELAALLTAVLDRLGAAHHRPFSRS